MLEPIAKVENVQLMLAADGVMKDIERVFSDVLEDRMCGGYVSLIDPDVSSEVPSLTFPTGRINTDKASKYHDFSGEKPLRALAHEVSNSFIADHDPDKDQWGGGFWIDAEEILTPFGIGFSGLPENLDAVTDMLLVVRTRIILPEGADRFIHECEVPELNELWQVACDKRLL